VSIKSIGDGPPSREVGVAQSKIANRIKMYRNRTRAITGVPGCALKRRAGLHSLIEVLQPRKDWTDAMLPDSAMSRSGLFCADGNLPSAERVKDDHSKDR
jgi:hypothetical protein